MKEKFSVSMLFLLLFCLLFSFMSATVYTWDLQPTEEKKTKQSKTNEITTTMRNNGQTASWLNSHSKETHNDRCRKMEMALFCEPNENKFYFNIHRFWNEPELNESERISARERKTETETETDSEPNYNVPWLILIG